MNQLELENMLSRRVQEIAESGLVSKCVYLANHLGKCLHKSSEWFGSHYVYEGKGFVLDVYTYAMGDKEVKVNTGRKRVFEVKQWVNDEPTSGNPTVVEGGLNYELKVYLEGPWRKTLEDLYGKHTTPVSEEKLRSIKSRITI